MFLKTIVKFIGLPYTRKIMSKKVIVLLPAWNERKSIEKFQEEVLNEEQRTPGWRYEILIVVDERSNDGTFEYAQKLSKQNPKIHVIEVGPGLGTALIKGHQYAIEHFKPDALAQLDADGQVSADVLPRLLQALEEGNSLAIGSRFVKGGKNLLSPSRRFFSASSSVVSRILMGPFDIKEWSNSARAFTPELFNKIDLKLVPWEETTFIIQPSFLNAAIRAGAKYKEVPLIFKSRAEGYSKMKIFNYTYDVISYAIDARLKKWGMDIGFYKISRKTKTPVKFGMVGFVGTLVDFIFYKIFINYFGLPPATAKGLSTEVAIVNNFLLNNYWTFKYRKTKTSFWQKFGIFNLVSLGGLVIGVLIVKYLHNVYGDGFIDVFGRPVAFNNFYFFATIPPVMIWNFLINHFVTWRHSEDSK